MYLCPECGIGFVTVDVDIGITPNETPCIMQGCKGMAWSWQYNVPPSLTPGFEWYRPSCAEVYKMNHAQRAHINAGALHLRKIQRKATSHVGKLAERVTAINLEEMRKKLRAVTGGRPEERSA